MFDAAELRRELPQFELDAPPAVSLNVQKYRHYYGLDDESLTKKSDQSVQSMLGLTHVQGYDIAVHLYRVPEPKGTVVVVHGYYDHVGLYSHLIRFLIKENYHVVAFDLPGHGLSSGDAVAIPAFTDYQWVLRHIINQTDALPGPWFAIGQSTGAGILAQFALTAKEQGMANPFAKMVFYAPLLRPVKWFWGKQLHRIAKPFFKTVPRTFKQSSNDPEFTDFIRDKDPLQAKSLSAQWVGALKEWIPFMEHHAPVEFPVLIIQGEKDETVDWQHNVPFYQYLFGKVEVIFLKNLRHQVVNELEIYRKDVFCRTRNYLELKT